MNLLLGSSASSGIGIGKAYVLPDLIKQVILQNHITKDQCADEWTRFEKAVSVVLGKIQKQLKDISSVKNNKTQNEILETYSLMLQDSVFLAEVKKTFEDELYNIEYILDKKASEYADQLRNSGNEYLAERAQDITDVFGRVINELMDIHPFDISQIPDGAVLVAQSLNASDAFILSSRGIAGLALTEGGISSHVAILARNYGVPAVFSLPKVSSEIKTNDVVIVDGNNGEVIINPDELTLSEYDYKIKKEENHRKVLELFRTRAARTKDGTRFRIYANIGTPAEAAIAKEEGADGIGLFRTEFLFMNEEYINTGMKSLNFSEDVQFEAYRQVLETMAGKPVTIRTLDAGGDKLIKSIDIPADDGKNPLLGLRAIRLSLKYPQIMKTQLRALYRASVFGNLEILIPLVTSIDQVRQVKAIAGKVRDELSAERIPFKKDVPIGIMVETAAAAVAADCFAKESDFFSIGTNDLTQYTIGVDRENSSVALLYNEFHLSVLRLIQNTITAAKKAKIPIAVCGEMASRPDSAAVLAGMGIRTLSMSPKYITTIKEEFSRITIKELEAISSKSLNSL